MLRVLDVQSVSSQILNFGPPPSLQHAHVESEALGAPPYDLADVTPYPYLGAYNLGHVPMNRSTVRIRDNSRR